MNYLSDKFLLLVLSIALVFSPLQNIMASVSDCLSTSQAMHHHMKISGEVMQHEMNQADHEDDCCKQNACDMTHCANGFTALFTLTPVNEVAYTVSSLSLTLTDSLTPFYPSVLYRPPKI